MYTDTKDVFTAAPVENPCSGVYVQIYGVNDHRFGWHFGNLLENREKDSSCDIVLRQIAELAQFKERAPHHNVNRAIIAPRPEFGRTIISAGVLSERFNIDPTRGVCLWRGRRADAFELMPGNVGAWATADCPTVVVKTPSNRVFAIHAGLKCLVETDMIATGCPREARIAGSILDQVIGTIPKEERAETEVHSFAGIGPKHFRHPVNDPKPQYRERNKKIVHYLLDEWGNECFEGNPVEGQISLERLIRLQLQVYGIRCVHFDQRDTYGDTKEDGTPRYYSQRRGDAGRNLVLIWNVPWNT